MNPAKYFFGCPTCGYRYLQKFSHGSYRSNRRGRWEHVTYHKFMCEDCRELFIRITKDGELIGIKIKQDYEYILQTK